MKEEIDPDVELDKMDDNGGDKNPYRANSKQCRKDREYIIPNGTYMQYDKNPKNFHAMSIKPINKSKINVGRKGGEKDRFTSEVSWTLQIDLQRNI